MRTLSILVAAVAVLSLSSAFTAAQAATRTGVTSTPPRLGTTDTTHLYLAAKAKIAVPSRMAFALRAKQRNQVGEARSVASRRSQEGVH